MNSESKVEIIISKNARARILSEKRKLESKLKVKLLYENNSLAISGSEVAIFLAEKVINAIERNFETSTALLLLNENYVLEDIPIKQVTKRKNLETIKARIIGTEGKTINIISQLSDSYLTLNNNTVSIIAPAEKIKELTTALISLIQGTKQSKVYSYLEKNRKKQESPEKMFRDKLEE